MINYDVYQMKYSDYSDVKGVLTVYNQQDFTAMLNRLTSDEAYFSEVQRSQQVDSKSWGMLESAEGV